MLCALSPSKLSPHIIKENILDIDFQELHDKGFRFIVFDQDNTLAKHHNPEVLNEDFYKKVAEVEQIFGDENIAICTNYANSKGLFYKGERMNIDLIEMSGKKKPFCKNEIIMHFNTKKRGRGEAYFEGEKCVVIGDRHSTDIAQAHILGGVGILVQPFDLEGEVEEYGSMKFVRFYEKFFWEYLTGCRIAKFKGEIFDQKKSQNENFAKED